MVCCGDLVQADPVIDRADGGHTDSQASPERQDPCKTAPPTPGFKHAVETEEDCNKLGHYWTSEVELALWRGEDLNVPVQRGDALHTGSQRAAGRCRSYPTELGLLPEACCMRRQEGAAGQLRRESAIHLLGPRCHCRSFC